MSSFTKILAVGDIVGKAGRIVLDKCLAKAREKHSPDIVIVNAENAAGGFGITKKIYNQLTDKMQIDVLTTGNHWHSKREVHEFRADAKQLLVPGNMMNVDYPTEGLKIFETRAGQPYAVINLIGCTFMNPNNRNAFRTAESLMKEIPERIKIRVLDFHAEATSEKQALANFLDGQLSLFYGTHTHTPTADERILSNGTGYVTDIGLSGAYDSIIGMKKEAAIRRFITQENQRLEPATENLWFCFCVATVDDETGRCLAIERERWILNDMELFQRT